MGAAMGAGPPTSELYGKFTWVLDKFSGAAADGSGKRELRSSVFEVGNFKWWVPALQLGVGRMRTRAEAYACLCMHAQPAAAALCSLPPMLPAPACAHRYLLVYPHGCDVANHLSLFLCVADYDKLLPGWSQFAQVGGRAGGRAGRPAGRQAAVVC